MSEKQDDFLDKCRENEKVVTIFLVSGVRIEGVIQDYDNFSVTVLDEERNKNLIYKHAISTIVG